MNVNGFLDSKTLGMVENQQLMSIKPGTVISGRYEVVKCLGAGSMGLVYACRHIELAGQLVAVKVLFPEVAQDKVAAARFRNEIQAAYGVSHPNVVRAYEFIRDDKMLAYTMEFVGGGDVAEKLSDPAKLIPLNEILSIAIQMCLGVQAIHDAGIVHRDLKPENILLTKDGQVKIADFGIAKAGNGPRLTEHGGVVGTIDYVSPEYMLNAQVDWRSDIYAMGVLLYEMLTGSSPFQADSVYATMTKRLKTDPTPPSRLRAECPQELDKIVERAMQRNPELRYQSASEMGQDLSQINEMLGFESKFIGSKPASSRSIVSNQRAGSSLTENNTFTAASKSTHRPEIIPERSKGNEIDNARLNSMEFESVVPSRVEGGISANNGQNKAKSGIFNVPDSAQTVLLDASSQQMEAVLSGKVSVFDTWDSQSKHRASRVNNSKASRSISRPSRSLWPAFITFIVAIVVGVSVGIGVLWFFAPQVLDKWKGIAQLSGGQDDLSTSNGIVKSAGASSLK